VQATPEDIGQAMQNRSCRIQGGRAKNGSCAMLLLGGRNVSNSQNPSPIAYSYHDKADVVADEKRRF